MHTFTHTTLGRTGIDVHRLGLSTTYRPGTKAVREALDAGLNFFFGFGIDTQMMQVLRDLPSSERQRLVIATGAYNLIFGHTNIRRSLEKRLRQLRTDYIDVFLFLGVMKAEEFPEHVREAMLRLREEGKVRAVGLSTHDRPLAGRLAAEGDLDVLMVRYNAAHRGAERDIFPHVALNDPGIVGYTATRWTALLRRPRGYDGAVPSASQCYRFVLSNPAVHVCLTAPRNRRELRENLEGLQVGPLDGDEMELMHRFGDAVYRRKKWFM